MHIVVGLGEGASNAMLQSWYSQRSWKGHFQWALHSVYTHLNCAQKYLLNLDFSTVYLQEVTVCLWYSLITTVLYGRDQSGSLLLNAWLKWFPKLQGFARSIALLPGLTSFSPLTALTLIERSKRASMQQTVMVSPTFCIYVNANKRTNRGHSFSSWSD